MKKVCTVVLVLVAAVSFAQESNHGKKLWAKSILNEKAPELIVEQWVSKQPDTEGKFVLIDFWATWCGPCRAYIPTLNNFQEKYADKIAIIGVSDETAEKVQAFDNPKIKYFEAIDTKGVTKNMLQVKGIPHAILIDPNGIVRWEGFPLLDGNELTDKVIKDLLEKYKK